MRMLLAAVLAASFQALAQYPDKPVTMVTGYPAGGNVDIVARLVAEGMKPRFPKGIVITYKPGAAGAVGVTELVRSAPDGYTIILTPHSALVIAAQVQELAYKTPDDYDPFANVVSYYPMLAVRADSRFRTLQDLVREAKANPGKLSVGSPGEGTSSHLNLEVLMIQAGIRVTHTPFKGWAQSSPALLGGHIDALVAQPAELKGQVDGKAMRVLAAFQPKRHPIFPDVPTAKEAGYEVANGVWFLLMAPKGTPAPVIKQIHDAAKAAIEEPAFKAAMDLRGVDVDYRPGSQLRTELWREYKAHTAILKRIGMIKQ